MASEVENLKPLLLDGLSEMDLQCDHSQADALLTYIELMLKWSKAYNLTAITSPKDILIKHIFEVLAHRLPPNVIWPGPDTLV